MHGQSIEPASREITLLLADDDALFLDSTAELLRQSGYRCETARDATEALEKIQGDPPDLLIADIRMPGNEELELVRELERRGPRLPVILVSGHPDPEIAASAIELPVVALLYKPFEFEELETRIAHSLRRHRLLQGLGGLRRRLAGMEAELRELESGREARLSDGRELLDDFLSLTLGNIAASLFDLRAVVEGSQLPSIRPRACQLMNCPRQVKLVHALRETVEVLEATKQSFRSRRLAELRQKLEQLLEEGG